MAKHIQVLLLEAVKKLGQKGEIISVSAGHARNYLIPQNLAVIATPELLKKRERLETKETEQKQEAVSKLQPTLDKLHNEGLTFVVPANEDGQLFGSINLHTIEKALVEKFGDEIEASQMQLELTTGEKDDKKDKPALRHVGVFTAGISFPKLPQQPQTTFNIHIKPLMK